MAVDHYNGHGCKKTLWNRKKSFKRDPTPAMIAFRQREVIKTKQRNRITISTEYTTFQSSEIFHPQGVEVIGDFVESSSHDEGRLMPIFTFYGIKIP